MNVNEIASLGSNVKPVIQNENCSILMLNDATGEGVMMQILLERYAYSEIVGTFILI